MALLVATASSGQDLCRNVLLESATGSPLTTRQVDRNFIQLRSLCGQGLNPCAIGEVLKATATGVECAADEDENSTPAGSGSEIQARSTATTFQALTGSSISGSDLILGGSLGIGGAPVNELHVQGTTAVYVTVEGTQADNAISGFILKNVDQEWQFRVKSNEDWMLRDQTGSTNVFIVEDGAPANAIFVDSTGGVGFGLDPVADFHLQESTTDIQPAQEIEQLSTGDAAIQFSIVGDAYALGIDNTDDRFKFSYASVAGTAVVGINDLLVIEGNTGDIGINIANPNEQLDVGGNIELTGNIIVGGTVDGRDIAADGALLDDAVLQVDYNANTILAANVDNTPLALAVATSRIVGRAATGNINDLTATQVRGILNVEDGADVTDFPNVDSALDGNTVTNFRSIGLDDDASGTILQLQAGGALKMFLAGSDLLWTSSGTAGATETAWIEVDVGATTAYIRLWSTK